MWGDQTSLLFFSWRDVCANRRFAESGLTIRKAHGSPALSSLSLFFLFELGSWHSEEIRQREGDVVKYNPTDRIDYGAVFFF